MVHLLPKSSRKMQKHIHTVLDFILAEKMTGSPVRQEYPAFWRLFPYFGSRTPEKPNILIRAEATEPNLWKTIIHNLWTVYAKKERK